MSEPIVENAAPPVSPQNGAAAGTPLRDAGTRAAELGAEASGAAKELAGQAAAEGASAAALLKERAASVAAQQKDNVAGKIQDMAEAVHRSGEQLEGHQDIMAQLVERGADELSMLAQTLRSNDLQGLLGNIGSLAKRQPALFTGLSLAAGFALSRVGKMAAAGASKDDLPHLPEVINEH